MTTKKTGALAVDLTEGAIRVRWGDKTLTIVASPSPPDAEDSPDFIIQLDDLECWDAPHDAEEINVKDLQKILTHIEVECARRGLSVEFE